MKATFKLSILIRKTVSLISKTDRWITSGIKKIWINFAFPDVEVCNGVTICQGVRLEATDGGRIKIGCFTVIESGAWIIASGGNIMIGRNTFIGRGSVIVSQKSILIGDDALVGEYVTIRDQNHCVSANRPTRLNGFMKREINIASNVWIGAKATILSGVCIGKNSVVGAGSVVTKNIASNVLAAGAPAQHVQNIFELDSHKN